MNTMPTATSRTVELKSPPMCGCFPFQSNEYSAKCARLNSIASTHPNRFVLVRLGPQGYNLHYRCAVVGIS